MKKKFLTVIIVFLAVFVLTILFVPRTTKIEAKLENDNAQILQVDVKSKNYLILEDRAKGTVRLTIGGELWSYDHLTPVTDPNGPKSEVEYPMYMPMWRYDSDSDQLIPATLFFDKDSSCFVLREGTERYVFTSDSTDAETLKIIEEFTR